MPLDGVGLHYHSHYREGRVSVGTILPAPYRISMCYVASPVSLPFFARLFIFLALKMRNGEHLSRHDGHYSIQLER